ncbi:MAG: hypothetical protein ABJC87_24210 [Roseobacter sp.]
MALPFSLQLFTTGFATAGGRACLACAAVLFDRLWFNLQGRFRSLGHLFFNAGGFFYGW